MTKLYVELAQKVGAYLRCKADVNNGNLQKQEWAMTHRAAIQSLIGNFLPSGSGFDNGTKLDLDLSTEEKLVFHTSFHHMDEHGMYSGWTEHTVTVVPSLAFGFRLRVSGRNHNGIKELITDEFNSCLDISPEPFLDQERDAPDTERDRQQSPQPATVKQ